MPNDEARELKEAVDRVVDSKSKRKLVMAGPGAGKTFLFKRLLEALGGSREKHLVITFVNNLKNDLEDSLGDLSQVFTLHGYCQSLLHRHDQLRNGLTADFVCRPGLISVIKRDWEWLRDPIPPEFIKLMRELNVSDDQKDFYLSRSNYYDAVDFDDSVFRVYDSLIADPGAVPVYDLVLIDEFQDFNKLEASVVALLGQDNPIVVAGDDDQVLYSSLRQANWDHIRGHHNGGEYEVFYLPFCMRCPKVIVEAIASILRKAVEIGALLGQIDKPYRYCELAKGEDSRANPHIDLVRATAQRLNANYFGKYIEKVFRRIPQAHADEAAQKNEPLILVIGSKPYMPQIEAHLVAAGLYDPVVKTEESERDEALRMLARSPDSNLGWRLILACGDVAVAREKVREAWAKGCSLVEVFPAAERDAILAEAQAKGDAQEEGGEQGTGVARIKLTSYEGSKGLSAQYVFLVGLHENELPKNATNVKDLEICRFLVGLTRTKKKCTILTTRRFGNAIKQPSAFLFWIDRRSYNGIAVNAAYWQS